MLYSWTDLWKCNKLVISSGNCRLDFQTQIRTGGQRTSFFIFFAVGRNHISVFFNSFNVGYLYINHSHKGCNKCVPVSEGPKLCLPKVEVSRKLFKSLFGNI